MLLFHNGTIHTVDPATPRPEALLVDDRGALAPGIWADLAVLSADPLATPPERLAEIVVEQTYVGGGLVYER